jgi:hypothetical protein
MIHAPVVHHVSSVSRRREGRSGASRWQLLPSHPATLDAQIRMGIGYEDAFVSGSRHLSHLTTCGWSSLQLAASTSPVAAENEAENRTGKEIRYLPR